MTLPRCGLECGLQTLHFKRSKTALRIQFRPIAGGPADEWQGLLTDAGGGGGHYFDTDGPRPEALGLAMLHPSMAGVLGPSFTRLLAKSKCEFPPNVLPSSRFLLEAGRTCQPLHGRRAGPLLHPPARRERVRYFGHVSDAWAALGL